MKTRSLPPGFFSDERVVALSIHARYLLLGMTTRADDRGCLVDSAGALHQAIFQSSPEVDVQSALAELVFADWALPFRTPDGRTAHAISQFMAWQTFPRVCVSVPLPGDAAQAEQVLAHVGWHGFIARAPRTKIKANSRSKFALAETLLPPRPSAPPPLPAAVQELLEPQVRVKKVPSLLPAGLIERIAVLWNEICADPRVNLASVLKVSEGRRRMIHSLVREYPALATERAWAYHFLRIARTPRLVQGWSNDQRADKTNPWRPDFEFALRASSFIKLHEGSYGEGKVSQQDIDRYGLQNLMGKRFLLEIRNPESLAWSTATTQAGGNAS